MLKELLTHIEVEKVIHFPTLSRIFLSTNAEIIALSKRVFFFFKCLLLIIRISGINETYFALSNVDIMNALSKI